ncbi:hypothetical protein P7C71_g3612, partial [Lecanoromycetidae sp. Uapishka_2]
MRFQSSSHAIIGCTILASTVSAQFFLNSLPSCWQTCIKHRGPQCPDTDLDCACHFASTSNLLPILISCVRNQCTDTSLAGYLIAPFGALQTACSNTQYTISDDDVASVSAAAASAKVNAAASTAGGDTVTATGLTRAHKVAAAVTTSGGAAASSVAGTTAAATTTPFVLASSVSGTTQGSSASTVPVVIASDTSVLSSTSTATSSSSSTKATSTANGGTVLDQAGNNLGSRLKVGSGLGMVILGACVLTGRVLL